MITKITCRYSFEVLDFNCNDFGFTFNVGVSYLGILIRHQWCVCVLPSNGVGLVSVNFHNKLQAKNKELN